MGRNWAIAIGINQYRYLQPLHYAVGDAAAMCDYFGNEVRFEQIYYFSDTSPPLQQDHGPPFESIPTFTTLKRFLRSRFDRPFLQTGDNLWFFFAGHGIRYEDRDYLMPLDGDPGAVEETAIPISYVTDRLRRSGADNVVLLIDACRNEGRRAGVGVGEEVPQGVVTLFSCSPRESSYELEALQQGAFTHTLLQGLRLQGEGNCATVERLDQYLRVNVPSLNRQFNKPRQTPYATVEPAAKYHLILLPRQATLRDAETLKMAAYEAETEQLLELAEQLWVRVLAVSPADSAAISGIRRLDRLTAGADAGPAMPRSVPGARSPVVPQWSLLSFQLSRRRLLQLAGGIGGVGAGIAVLPRLLQLLPSSTQPSPALSPAQTASPSVRPTHAPGSPQSGSNLPLKPFTFDVVTVNAQGKETRRQRQQAQGFAEDLGNGGKLAMVVIKGGAFSMWSPPAEKERADNEGPQHSVTVKTFGMGKYAVTQAQWRAVAALPQISRTLEPDPTGFKGDQRPVEGVYWQDAMEFCARLSKQTGRQYRLPSEAEWEYACRAGTTTPFHFGETMTTDLVNYNGIYTYAAAPQGKPRAQTTDVGSFPPNAFGLFDMHGNVWEWCLDYWHDNYQGAPTDGSAWIAGGDLDIRLLRGGSWNSDPRSCRSAYRGRGSTDRRTNGIGFRVVCVFA